MPLRWKTASLPVHRTYDLLILQSLLLFLLSQIIIIIIIIIINYYIILLLFGFDICSIITFYRNRFCFCFNNKFIF